jgi:predicted nicotinamide N-methyase
MSIYAVTHSVTPTAQAKKVVDATTSTDISTIAETPVVAEAPVTSETQTTAPIINAQTPNAQTPVSPSLTSPSNDITGSLTQNVLQTMQNMGFSTASLSADDKQILQNFVQSLYKALAPMDVPSLSSVGSPIDTNSTSVNAANTIKTDMNTLISGGDGFKYTIDVSDANLGEYLSNVIDSLKTAFANIGQYIHSDVVFNVKVIGQNTSNDILAEADATMTEATTQTENVIDTSFVSDVTYKSELHPNSPDANLFINLGRIGDMSFKGEPSPDKFDFTSIITHEILHGIAFTGVIGNAATPLRTKYDELVMMQNNKPYFVGVNAQKANAGNPVPLVPESAGNGSAYYHVDVQGDLMAETIKKGQVSPISPLDIAMLQDLGIPVVPNTGLPPKAQIAYDSPSNSLQKLIGAVQEANTLNANFDRFMLTFTDKTCSSAPIKLQDFLTQLALNTVNNNSLQNTVGSYLSIAA